MADADHPLDALIGRLNRNHSLTREDREALLALPYKLRWLEAGHLYRARG